MNQRQRDLFLWIWSRRRTRGRLNIALIGAGIGALGGLGFTLLFFWLPTLAGQSIGTLDTSEMAPFLAAIADRLGPQGFVALAATLAFGGMGLFMADRVYSLNERQYQALLDAGASIPATKPMLTVADRAPMFAVLAVFAAIAIFLIVMLVWELQRGNL